MLLFDKKKIKYSTLPLIYLAYVKLPKM